MLFIKKASALFRSALRFSEAKTRSSKPFSLPVTLFINAMSLQADSSLYAL